MTLVATHDGPFHADDVTAYALIRGFVDPDARVVRTRDPAVIAQADLVIDVGGAFDPAAGRFDHHQASYTGPRSSAGLVLDWLADSGRIDPELADILRKGIVDYLDAVDTGRTAPNPNVPCLPRIVEALTHGTDGPAALDDAFRQASAFVGAYLAGVTADLREVRVAADRVREAMAAAVARGSLVIELPEYLPWKVPYFASGGETHPTAFVLHPGSDGNWRIVAIPPKLGDFGQKRPLPEAWAGLTDDALAAVTGVPGSVFCHKNRFIAVFRTRDGAEQALRSHGLWARAGG